MLANLFGPSSRRQVRETRQQAGPGNLGLGISRLRRIETDKIADIGQTVVFNHWPDVVQHDAGQAVPDGIRQRHRDKPAARSAKDRGAVDTEVVHQFDRVAGPRALSNTRWDRPNQTRRDRGNPCVPRQRREDAGAHN